MIHYGQPVDANADIGVQFACGDVIEVYQVVGQHLPFDGYVTQKKLSIAQLLCPLDPNAFHNPIRCLGVNFRKHVEEASQAMPQTPVLFVKPDTSLAGPGKLSVPKFVHSDEEGEQLDYETELAVILSQDAKDVQESEAYKYVLGYVFLNEFSAMCFGLLTTMLSFYFFSYTSANDVSARFHQFRQAQWSFAKGFDSFAPIGPVLVHHRAIENINNLEFTGSLNSEVMQNDNTSDWIFDVAKTISFLSSGTTIRAGSVILMGTPSGVGWFKTPRKMIRNGDIFAVWHSGGIGTLLNEFEFE